MHYPISEEKSLLNWNHVKKRRIRNMRPSNDMILHRMNVIEYII